MKTDRQTTHADDCWSWGPKHYECAIGKIERDEALLRQALEALIWTTGSEDFGEGGLAREGALKLLFPTIAALRERLGEKA
jgi:hypothetical protein